METYNRKLARTIDLINEYVIKYYKRKSDILPDPLEIQSQIYTKHNDINSVDFEFAIRIMKEEGLIEYISNDEKDEIIRELKHTSKGLLLYLDQGMTKKFDRERNKARLITFGQISVILAGVYYIIEIINKLLEFLWI